MNDAVEEAIINKGYSIGSFISTHNDTDIYNISKNDKNYVIKINNSENSCVNYLPEYLKLVLMDHPNIMKLTDTVIYKNKNKDYDHIGFIFNKLTCLDNYKDKIEWETFKLWMCQAVDICLYLKKNCILHNDIFLRNLFFDENYNLILGDFGISAVKPYINHIKYDDNYPIAPEYFTDNEITSKANTYSFAAVFLQLIQYVDITQGVDLSLFSSIQYSWLITRDDLLEDVRKVVLEKCPNYKFTNINIIIDNKPYKGENDEKIKHIRHICESLELHSMPNASINWIIAHTNLLQNTDAWKFEYYILIQILRLYYNNNYIDLDDEEFYNNYDEEFYTYPDIEKVNKFITKFSLKL